MNKPESNNIRGLVQDLSERLDQRMQQLRDTSPELNVRPADAKMFMHVARHAESGHSVSKIAKMLGISRQAAHASVQRLVANGSLKLELTDGNKRDKVPKITKKGHNLRQQVTGLIVHLENEMITALGAEDLETLRNLLARLVASKEI